MAYNKENKYNYLEHSFEKELQRSYDRNNRFSPPSLNSSNIRSPAKFRSPLRSSEFSPYENKQQNVRDKILVQELTNHNRLLNQQIQQYKAIMDKLHAELRLRMEEFSSLEMLRQKQRLIHDEAVNQMRDQIGILLTKNAFLQERNMNLEKEIKKFQSQITKNEARTRSLSVVAANSKQSSSKFIQQIGSILQGGTKIKKRDLGKLMNQTFSNVNSVGQSPKNSSKQASFSEEIIIEHVESLKRKVQKYEQLCDSITQMHLKITGKKIGHDNGELKLIWKWLKELGHNYNIMQKWKKMLMDVLGLSKGHKSEELSIDDVLQKTIVQLHSK